MLTAIQELSTVQIDIDEALHGYLVTALCFSTDENGVAYSVFYDVDDIPDFTQAECFVDLSKFLYEFRKITKHNYDGFCVGSDFWLSRNSLREGFATSVYGAYADKLDSLAKSYKPKVVIISNHQIQFK